MADSKNKKQKKCLISEEDISTLLQRYKATTVLALLQEVAEFEGVKIDWNALVKKTSTGISNAREYQMLWRYLAYRHALLEKLDDGAEPLDEDSDLEYDLEAFPSVTNEASNEAAACVKVMIASGLPSDSSHPNSSTVEAPLTINIPNGQPFRATSEKPQPSAIRGMNITVPVSVQKLPLPSVTPAEGVDAVGSTSGTYPPRRKRNPWSEPEDLELISCVEKYGEGNWATILRCHFKGDRTASQLSQRWAIIRKRKGISKSAANSSSLLLTEVQEAARHAMNLALDLPIKNTIANRSSGTPSNTMHGSSMPSTSAAAAAAEASSAQQRPTVPPTSTAEVLPAQHHSQQNASGKKSSAGGPTSNGTSVSSTLPTRTTKASLVQHQSQQCPTLTKSLSIGPSSSARKSQVFPAQRQSQQNATLKKSSCVPTSNNMSVSCVPPAPTTDASSVQHQSQKRPILTKSSSMGPSGLAGKSEAISQNVPAHSLEIDLDAAAKAAGARIATPSDAASVLVHSVHYFSTGMSSRPVVSSSMKASSQPSQHAPSSSATSLSMLSEYANNKLPPKPNSKTVGEIKKSSSKDVGNEQVQEDGACSLGNESSMGVQDDKATLSNQEAEYKSELVVVESSSVPSTLEKTGGDLLQMIDNRVEGSRDVKKNILASPTKVGKSPSARQENGETQSVSDRQEVLPSVATNESGDKMEVEAVPGNRILDAC